MYMCVYIPVDGSLQRAGQMEPHGVCMLTAEDDVF